MLILFIFFSHSSLTLADSIEDAANSISTEEKKRGPYKDKTTYYQNIDVASYEELKEIKEKKEGDKDKFTLNPFTSIGNYFSEKVDDTLNSSKDMMVSTLLMMVSIIFEFNNMMTDFLLTCLEASMDSNIINFLINISEEQVQLIAGVDGNQIHEGKGIFGSLAGLASLISIMYMVYLFTIKRAPLAGLNSLLHPILAITVSIMFFSNFGLILRGINDITTELTNKVSSATVSGDTDNMADNIQKVFVHRPYLYLQFNSGNEEKIGQKRIDALLLSKPGSKEKRAAVKKEIMEYNNSMMEPESVIKRLIYTALFVVINGLLSIPVWILAVLFVALQVWFLLIAVLAPFVLIWSILPNQISVMQRFAIELLYPMSLKVMIGVLALLLFTFSRLAFLIPATDGLKGYYLSTFFQFVFFFVAFLIRNRIKAIFNSTRGFVREMRNSTQIMMAPVKESVQNTAMIVGAGVGAATGNPAAAVQGAAIGRNLGKTLVGEKDALGTTAQLVSLGDISNQKNGEQEKTAQIPTKGQSPTTTQPIATPVSEGTAKENVLTGNAIDEPQNKNTDTSASYQNKGQKENTQPTTMYVPLQDLEEFKPRTNSGEQVKQKAVGSPSAQDYKELELSQKQEGAKRQSLQDLNKTQQTTPTNDENYTPSEQSKPSYQEIQRYQESKFTTLPKVTNTTESITSDEDLSNKSDTNERDINDK